MLPCARPHGPGATRPAESGAAGLRAALPKGWFLSPGIGAQGGDLAAALDAGLDADGTGMLLPISRGISKAASPREAAETFRKSINARREARVTVGVLQRKSKNCVS